MQKYNPRNEKKKSIEELEVKIEENSPNVWNDKMVKIGSLI